MAAASALYHPSPSSASRSPFSLLSLSLSLFCFLSVFRTHRRCCCCWCCRCRTGYFLPLAVILLSLLLSSSNAALLNANLSLHRLCYSSFFIVIQRVISSPWNRVCVSVCLCVCTSVRSPSPWLSSHYSKQRRRLLLCSLSLSVAAASLCLAPLSALLISTAGWSTITIFSRCLPGSRPSQPPANYRPARPRADLWMGRTRSAFPATPRRHLQRSARFENVN